MGTLISPGCFVMPIWKSTPTLTGRDRLEAWVTESGTAHRDRPLFCWTSTSPAPLTMAHASVAISSSDFQHLEKSSNTLQLSVGRKHLGVLEPGEYLEHLSSMYDSCLFAGDHPIIRCFHFHFAYNRIPMECELPLTPTYDAYYE